MSAALNAWRIGSTLAALRSEMTAERYAELLATLSSKYRVSPRTLQTCTAVFRSIGPDDGQNSIRAILAPR